LGTVYYLGFIYVVCFQNVVTKLQNDWLGHWVSLLIGHYAEPELEGQVVSFVDQLLEGFAEGGDILL
jgi:hypothetical protein